jgi:NitT/TauT family transport system ATP-binding protein
MPTAYPKCTPTELMGFLVLVDSHKGSEDIARMADDLDLEIDEILPSVDYSQALQLLKVADGRATLTDLGRRVLASSIRDRKAIVREQLGKTTLFRTLMRTLESAPGHQISDDDLVQLLSLAQAPIDEVIQNIVTWGRYAEIFRYDAAAHRIVGIRRPPGKTSGGSRPPVSPGQSASAPGGKATSAPTVPQTRAAPVAA